MMRPHCDRCDKLCDEQYPHWLEDKYSVVGCRAGANPIWHIVIHGGGQVPTEAKMFCRACSIEILEAYVKSISKESA